MTTADIKRLGLILAVQAEIEGMKAKNQNYNYLRDDTPYNESHFCDKANEIRDIVYKHDEQL